MVVSKPQDFLDYQGFVEMDADAKTFTMIEATIKAESINTNQDKRDTHLRNTDFLMSNSSRRSHTNENYQKQETAILWSEISPTWSHQNRYTERHLQRRAKDPWGNTRAGFSADGN